MGSGDGARWPRSAALRPFASAAAASGGITTAAHGPIPGSPQAEYDRRITDGTIEGGDAEQARTVRALEDLWERMEGAVPGWGAVQAGSADDGGSAGGGGGGGGAGTAGEGEGGGDGAAEHASNSPGRALVQEEARPVSMWESLFSGGGGAGAGGESSLFGSGGAHVRGLYLWSRSPGTGKTMLMDMFFDAVPLAAKRRVHFHDFMLDVHGRTHRVGSVADPLATVADGLAAEARLLCLDELMVTDVADAMMIGRLFDALWARGVVVVGTSNRHPTELYENGLQRELFMPFIDAVQERCVVHEIASGTDYRHRATLSSASTYFVGEDEHERLKERVRLTSGEPCVLEPDEVAVQMGRTIKVPRAAKLNRAALFRYDELCGEPVGAADFLGLLKAYPTLALSGVPIFDAGNKHTAYRFVTLVDVAYDQRAKLLIGAAGTPLELFENVVTVKEARETATSGETPNPYQVVDDNLGFAKERTISRLTEMQTKEYILTTKAMAHEHLKETRETKRRRAI
eukprot:PRCOL_00006651-RA